MPFNEGFIKYVVAKKYVLFAVPTFPKGPEEVHPTRRPFPTMPIPCPMPPPCDSNHYNVPSGAAHFPSSDQRHSRCPGVPGHAEQQPQVPEGRVPQPGTWSLTLTPAATAASQPSIGLWNVIKVVLIDSTSGELCSSYVVFFFFFHLCRSPKKILGHRADKTPLMLEVTALLLRCAQVTL